MRKIFLLWLAFLAISSQVAHADFFDEMVINTDVGVEQIGRINIWSYSFRSAIENTRYRSAVYFIETIKTEAQKRYTEGLISRYRMNDIIYDLDALTYSLDRHFFYYKAYEQTRRTEYREASEEYFQNSLQPYAKLKSTLERSNY